MPMTRPAVVGLAILLLGLAFVTFNRKYQWINESNPVLAWFMADHSGRRFMATICIGLLVYIWRAESE